MKPTAVRLDPYKHSSTSKYVVSWTTGRTPTRVERTAWEQLHPDATTEDRERFARGTWQRHRKFFKKRTDAATFAESQKLKLLNEGQRGLAISDEVRVMAARCTARLKPYGYTLDNAVDHFIEYIKATRRSVTVSALAVEYQAAKLQKGNKERSLYDIEHRLKKFSGTFGDRIVANITTGEIDDWLTSLGLSAVSQNNYRGVTRAFFEYAVKRDYAKSNPVARIDKVRVVDKPAAIFMPDELIRLLNAAPADVLPILAIGAFAGLRQAEILRLEWPEVDQVRGFIEVKASKSKTAQRRLVTMQPNLREWLRPYASHTGLIFPAFRDPKKPGNESHLRTRLVPLCKAAKLKVWPKNGLRHSYGSYHLAKFGNANALALEMGHTTTKEIFAHYRELVRPEEAERYWKIRPETESNVLAIDQDAVL